MGSILTLMVRILVEFQFQTQISQVDKTPINHEKYRKKPNHAKTCITAQHAKST
jgi:hypothetical protein